MTISWPKLGGVLVLAVVAMVWAVRTTKSSRPRLDTERHATIGRVLAEETAKRLDWRRMVVVLVPEASFGMPMVKAQYDAFRKSLPKDISIVAKETVRLEQMGPLDGLLTPDLYFTVADKNPGVNALVSFVGLGEFTDGQLARRGAGSPSLYLVSANQSVPQHYFDKGLVKLAIVPRQSMPTGKTGSAFERAYQVIGRP